MLVLSLLSNIFSYQRKNWEKRRNEYLHKKAHNQYSHSLSLSLSLYQSTYLSLSLYLSLPIYIYRTNFVL